MGKNRENSFTVAVHGIGYPVFAKLKWQQFLRGFSLAVVLLVAVVLIMAATGRMPTEVPLSVVLVIVLVVLAALAMYRSTIRREYRKSGIGSVELQYTFDRDGWTVRSGAGQARVLWSKTWRVRRNEQALLLYPNRKSVNLVPLRNLSARQVEQVIAWCTGKRPKKT